MDLERRTKRSGDARSSTASRTATFAGVRIFPVVTSLSLSFLCVTHVTALPV